MIFSASVWDDQRLVLGGREMAGAANAPGRFTARRSGMSGRPLARALTALAFVVLLTSAASAQSEVSPINPAVPDCNDNDVTSPDSALVTNVLPCTAKFNEKAPPIIPNIQLDFDFYSWLTFIALNWPADGKTRIGKGSGPGGDARAFWQDVANFRQLPDVMLPGGKEPTWGTPIVPPECASQNGPGKMIIHLIEETFNQPFRTGPLIDQNGNYALFDILINKPMFDYIVKNKLYSKEGQRQFVQAQFSGSPDVSSGSPGVPTKPPLAIVNFPKGTRPVPAKPPQPAIPGTMGALMLKVAWKVLRGDEDASKFHSVDALIYTAPQGTKPASCVAKKLGLVGFHASHKTQGEPQWLWSTFEHVDNAPEDVSQAAGKKFNFYDPACSASKCPVNATPPQPWNPQVEPFPNGFRSQIVRIVPLTQATRDLNKRFHGLDGIKGTAWENYILISTQWPSNPVSNVDPSGAPAPTSLANTTLETYSQGEVPLSSSSCMACHNNATTMHLPAGASDFTFTLEKAQ
jgi:hypothetical protein